MKESLLQRTMSGLDAGLRSTSGGEKLFELTAETTNRLVKIRRGPEYPDRLPIGLGRGLHHLSNTSRDFRRISADGLLNTLHLGCDFVRHICRLAG